ncbi:PREDICTED: uncharacterized protein LOC109220790 [Nicotiana attenuata]|uniref:uncharacterized protein LOC109220790 n=1 Tax=Nicotiana attenuata TaxID=49451 RepID=UPI000905D56B|nr:PREDICTED: uncharacterized protein LOC109220790 [Nicotiana attenuata]
MGHLHYFLGLEILSEPEGAIVCQRKFTLDLLSEFNCLDCTPVASPLDVAVKFKDVSGELLSDPTLYKQLAGKLNFLTNTRPDLAFAVQYLSRFMHAPSSVHLSAAYHVLRYVKGTLGQGLLISKASDFSLQAYCNSNWATCPTSRRSVSGYFVLPGGSILTWKSKKSIQSLFLLLKQNTGQCVSQSAINIARNPVFHERTKHIELDCHFVREKLHEGLMSLSFVPSSLQLADMLTKPLSGVHHRSILSKLGVANHPPT